MPRRSHAQPSFILSLIVLVGGLGMLAACIGIAADYGRAEIHLRREAGAVTGKIRWVALGIPVFWRSLDGLERVARDDYEVREESRGGSGALRTVSRVAFFDGAGHQLAWAERTSLVNEVEPMQRFLASTALALEAGGTAPPNEAFTFIEPSKRWTLRRVDDLFAMIIFIPLLLLGGLLLTLGGVLSLGRRIAGLIPRGASSPTRV